jgi:hypothetical protein
MDTYLSGVKCKGIANETVVASCMESSTPEQLGENGCSNTHTLKKCKLSKSMPSHVMSSLTAEDEIITSVRSSIVLTSGFPNPATRPPPGKFPRSSSTPDRFLRCRSVDDIAIRRAALHSHTPLRHSCGLLNLEGTAFPPLQENMTEKDSCSDNGHTTSLCAIWESLTLSPPTDAHQDSPPLPDRVPSDIAQALASPMHGGAPPPLFPPDAGAE